MHPNELVNQVIERLGIRRKEIKRVVRDCFEVYGLPGEMWPQWCFIPADFWFEALDDWREHITEFYDWDGVTTDEGRLARYWDLCHMVNMFFTWRYTRGIYRFAPELFVELVDNADDIDLVPADVLLRLPEWCIYIEVPPELREHLSGIWGYFVSINWRVNQPPKLQIFVNLGKILRCNRLSLFLERKPLKDQIEASIDFTAFMDGWKREKPGEDFDPALMRRSAGKFFNDIIKLLLYICVDAPDISNRVHPGSFPGNPQPVKKHKGYGYFVRKKPRIWTVGAKAAEKLRRAQAGGYRDKRGKVSIHWRKAHYHGVWRGPRDNPYFHLNWWPPIPVGVAEEED